MPINLWFVEFAQTERFTPAWVVLAFTFQVISAIIFIIRVSYRNFRPVMAGLALVYTFSVALQAFSYLYWEWETTQNFNILLTHFDSFYFALGTLTTAGTGHPRDRRVGVMRPSVATSMRVPDLTSV